MKNSDGSKILEWNDVEPIFKRYMSVWNNHISLNWARMAWNALISGGLANYNSDEEKNEVRPYALAISIIYYEYCHRTGWDESDGFIYWNESVQNLFQFEFIGSLNHDEEIIFKVKCCLLEHIGERDICPALWINCSEGKQGLVMQSQEKEVMWNQLLENGEKNINYRRGIDFIKGVEIDSIDNYHSVHIHKV